MARVVAGQLLVDATQLAPMQASSVMVGMFFCPALATVLTVKDPPVTGSEPVEASST